MLLVGKILPSRRRQLFGELIAVVLRAIAHRAKPFEVGLEGIDSALQFHTRFSVSALDTSCVELRQ